MGHTYPFGKIKPIEVETWLRQLPLARGSCAKIRNIMSVLFNHACRYELYTENPIYLVRQSAKRRRVQASSVTAEDTLGYADAFSYARYAVGSPVKAPPPPINPDMGETKPVSV